MFKTPSPIQSTETTPAEPLIMGGSEELSGGRGCLKFRQQTCLFLQKGIGIFAAVEQRVFMLLEPEADTRSGRGGWIGEGGAYGEDESRSTTLR